MHAPFARGHGHDRAHPRGGREPHRAHRAQPRVQLPHGHAPSGARPAHAPRAPASWRQQTPRRVAGGACGARLPRRIRGVQQRPYLFRAARAVRAHRPRGALAGRQPAFRPGALGPWPPPPVHGPERQCAHGHRPRGAGRPQRARARPLEQLPYGHHPRCAGRHATRRGAVAEQQPAVGLHPRGSRQHLHPRGAQRGGQPALR
mmetsp:Transcript_2188/g.6309  ORF Transcript_2188/g.6309 Transcript_2188/m.6309 type:complete len:203 (+) Transcript_2188:287-895(+)